jgi:hypothetical protein
MLYIKNFRFINRELCPTNSSSATQETSERTPEDAESASTPEELFKNTIFKCAESVSEKELPLLDS